MIPIMPALIRVTVRRLMIPMTRRTPIATMAIAIPIMAAQTTITTCQFFTARSSSMAAGITVPSSGATLAVIANSGSMAAGTAATIAAVVSVRRWAAITSSGAALALLPVAATLVAAPATSVAAAATLVAAPATSVAAAATLVAATATLAPVAAMSGVRSLAA